jgi:hypothetical protein
MTPPALLDPASECATDVPGSCSRAPDPAPLVGGRVNALADSGVAPSTHPKPLESFATV